MRKNVILEDLLTHDWVRLYTVRTREGQLGLSQPMIAQTVNYVNSIC